MLPYVAKHELWLAEFLEILLPSSAKVCYTFWKLISCELSETFHLYFVLVFLHEQWLRITEFHLLWLSKWLLRRSAKVCYAFWKLISASCDVISLTYPLPLPRALHIRSVVGHLISCYRISKFPPTASKGCAAAAAAAVAPRRGSCSRWLHKALAIWRRNKLMLKRNKQSSKERKQRWHCPNVFSAQSLSTSPAVYPVIMCR